MSVLVFDFGLKHIGVAVAERSENFAFALTSINAKNGKADEAQLASLFREWQPKELVVGLPLNMDGSATTIDAAVRRFANRLGTLFEVEVSLVDERLSSFEAAQRSKDNLPDHAVAAQVIAETWLNQVST